jgi:hypothetical protein
LIKNDFSFDFQLLIKKIKKPLLKKQGISPAKKAKKQGISLGIWYHFTDYLYSQI